MIDPIQVGYQWAHDAVEQLRAPTQPKVVKLIYESLIEAIDTLPIEDQAHFLKVAMVALLTELNKGRV